MSWLMETGRQRTILIHYNEIGLKGGNQPLFRRQLRENLLVKLRSRALKWPVHIHPGFFAVPVPFETSDAVVHDVTAAFDDVFGVAWCAATEPLPHRCFRGAAQARDLDNLEKALLALANGQSPHGKSFCVRVKRSEKSVPFTSVELEDRLGRVLTERTLWKTVNLKHPDTTFHVEIHREASFLFSNRLKGPGGLPVGTAGRVLVLLSGGIDSPVAAYLMAKRGCRVDYLHFTATSIQQDQAPEYKVWRLARQLNRFTVGSRLFLVPYTHYDVTALTSGKALHYDLVMFRRFMARVGETLARKLGAQALVSGDNLSQVASQTLSNLVSTSLAVDIPIFRPLIAFNKDEIVNLARQIGTYDASVEPYKDCCAIISQNPRTKSNPAYLARAEQHVFPKYEEMVEQTLADALTIQFKPGE